jgi:lipoate---protein ligase
MRNNLEIIRLSAPTVAQNLAIDDTMMRLASESAQHSIRFWWGGPPAVVLGFNEKTEQVIDSEACRNLGVDVLKRSTGGGSVLQASGVFNYSFIKPLNSILDPKRAFRFGTDLIATILQSFGLTGETEGISDVTVGGRKISGNAQAQRCRALLVHGTLLVDFDYGLADKVLRHPIREPVYRQGRSHREFLVSLRELGIRAHDIVQKAIEAAELLYGVNASAFGRVAVIRRR